MNVMVQKKSLFFCAILWCVAAGGCGRSEAASTSWLERYQQKTAPDAAPPAAKPAIAKRRPTVEKQAKPAAPAHAIASTPAAKKPQASADNIMTWTAADFLAARARGDLQLVAALAQRARQPQHTAEESHMLALLVASCPSATNWVVVDPRRGTSQASGQALQMRALVAALAANGTAEAEAALLQLVAGSLAAEAQQAVVEGALDTLTQRGGEASHHSPASPPSTPQNWTPSRRPVLPETLRNVATAAVRDGGSPKLRRQLAKAMTDPGLSRSARDALREFLSKDEGEDLEAQVELYGGTGDGAARAAVEPRLLGYGGQLLRELLQVPPLPKVVVKRPPARGSPTGWPASPAVDPPSRLGSLLNPEMASEVVRQLERLDSLRNQARLAALAATLPGDTVRAALCQSLRRNWGDGPGGLGPILLAPDACWDPGLMVSIKTAHRRSAGDAEWKNLRSSSARHMPVLHTKVYAQQASARAEEQRLIREWSQFRLSMLNMLFQRLQQAADARDAVARAGGDTNPSVAASAVKLPFALHDGARVLSRYDMRWPDVLPDWASTSNIGATEIHFIRIQQTTTRLKAIVEHYRHELGNGLENAIPNGTWLDSEKRLQDSGRRRSADVVFSRMKRPLATVDGQEEKVEENVEINVFVVEINDPTGAGQEKSRPKASAEPEPDDPGTDPEAEKKDEG